ncbi:MAG: hypothetical protein ACOYL3_18715 [Desulfuromonadaceae bacterium]
MHDAVIDATTSELNIGNQFLLNLYVPGKNVIGLQVWSAVHGLTMLQLDGQLRSLDITQEQFFHIGKGIADMLVRGLSAL